MIIYDDAVQQAPYGCDGNLLIYAAIQLWQQTARRAPVRPRA
jgi:hypothetical protein